MSENPYEKLGVSEDASFDEIQDVRTRLLEQYSGDAKHLEIIEASYDAILMDRLRMRQEGKIKVPERIRFPERLMQALPKEVPTPRDKTSLGLQKFLDTPSAADIFLPAAWYLGLSAITLFYQMGGDQVVQLVLPVGVILSIYFLNRKENRLGRSVLLSFGTLIIGLTLGAFIASWVTSAIPFIKMTANQFSTVLTFILFWLTSSFLR
jgi:hypothetical protein